MDKLKSVAREVGYWLVAGIPWSMAQAYRRLARWQPPKEAVVFKRVPLMVLLFLHTGGYLLWALDHYQWLLLYARSHPGFNDRRLGILDPAIWARLCRLLNKAVHGLLWTPSVGPLCWFWVWLVLFGPVSLGLTIYFLVKTRSEEFNPEDLGRFKISPEKVRTLREKDDSRSAFLGASRSAKSKAISLPDSWRTSHTYCVGASRSGKTVSVMLPLALQDIAKGHPVIFFDGKGDVEHLAAIAAQAEKSGRGKDLMLFSLSDPARSRSYNPLSFGNATQKKDKLIGAFTWTEEHYKKVSEDTLLTVILGLEGTGLYYNLEDLYLCLSRQEAVERVHELCKDPLAKEHLRDFYENFKPVTKDITGLVKDLGLIIKNDFWPLFDTYCPEIDFLEAIRQKKIIYLVFNTQAYQDTAERLARIFLQDLRAASDYIQNKVPREERAFAPIYVDEFNCFAFDAFGDFMSKCGGARFALTLAHQSLGQLVRRGDYFKDEILDNANIKIIMRQDSPTTIEEFARMIGTHNRTEYTSQTEDVFLFEKRRTGMGSMRTVEAFNVDPNIIRQLQPHQAVILVKQPYHYDLAQLDVRAGSSGDMEAIDRLLPQRAGKVPRGNGIDLRAHLRKGRGGFNEFGEVKP
ncbi:MAG: type IV secretory system conjugative DNA transfer family protein [Elusimicrobia bacterium]|nr:type IV secretory system conjugative DNA transfer family protein [Elusimicrobiota bacterium]MDE2424482.1 type IV secretory system conjugative DNA transfer family protein [Elusimicrobiota bacterium]